MRMQQINSVCGVGVKLISFLPPPPRAECTLWTCTRGQSVLPAQRVRGGRFYMHVKKTHTSRRLGLTVIR